MTCSGPPKYNIIILKNATFSQEFIYEEENGDPIDLTGCTARVQMRETIESPDPFITIDTEHTGTDGYITLGGVDGTIILTINDVTTENISVDRGVYDLLLIFADLSSKRLVEGSVIIKPGVTTP